MIIGTAGHIDHGKSRLVEALTGRAMDPYAEEKRRGITLDLHFAALDLGNGEPAGVIDVPGHEDLIRTMVAGAVGVDLVLLVVAADEGIMPQTREHLAILQQLQIPAGIPVITKSDLVEDEWADLVAAEVSEWLGLSPLRFTDPVIVSAEKGTGLDTLRRRIREAATSIATRPTGDLFRMPIDRALSMAGVGTVVTGTAWSGETRVGDTLQVLPGGRSGRVRTIQTHGVSLDQSRSGARTAIGLGGLDKDDARRGDVLAREGDPWVTSTVLDAEVQLLATAARGLHHRSRVRIHLGAAEVMARVSLKRAVEPGQASVLRLKLENPVVARGEDRLVVRSYSPVMTVGGGRVLDPYPPSRTGATDPELSSADPQIRGRALIRRRAGGVRASELPVLLGISPEAAKRLTIEGVELLASGWMFPTEALETAERLLLERVARHHEARPSDSGLPLETLRRVVRLPEPLVDAALTRLQERKRLVVSAAWVRSPDFTPRVTGGEAVVERLVGLVQAGGLTPPSTSDLATAMGRQDVAELLVMAARNGSVVVVERDRYYAVEALARFKEALNEAGQGREITVAGLRDRLGLSRKFLIPLLEWADAQRITQRVGDARHLLPRRND